LAAGQGSAGAASSGDSRRQRNRLELRNGSVSASGSGSYERLAGENRLPAVRTRILSLFQQHKVRSFSVREGGSVLTAEFVTHNEGKFGETPVLKLLDNGRGFSLLERMNLALTLKVEANTVSFSGSAMGIGTDALAYFSLGFLWKG
jgi:hypothetical protein